MAPGGEEQPAGVPQRATQVPVPECGHPPPQGLRGVPLLPQGKVSVQN